MSNIRDPVDHSFKYFDIVNRFDRLDELCGWLTEPPPPRSQQDAARLKSASFLPAFLKDRLIGC